jgi:hypothetical protein
VPPVPRASRRTPRRPSPSRSPPVTFGDWTLGAGAFPPPSDTIAASTPYRNLTSGGSQPVTTYIYGTSAALEAGKTVASVTLPTGSGSIFY